MIAPSQVAEIIVVSGVTLLPDEESRTLTVTVDGERDGMKQIETAPLDMYCYSTISPILRA